MGSVKATSVMRGCDRGVKSTWMRVSGGGARVGALALTRRGGGEMEVVVWRWYEAATGGREEGSPCWGGEGGRGGGGLSICGGAALHQGLDEEEAPTSGMAGASCWGGASGSISPEGEGVGMPCG